MSAYLTDIFHFLLGHSLDDWARGSLAFQTPLGIIGVLGVLVLLVLMVVVLYRRTTVRTPSGIKAILILLRVLTLAVLLVCLLKPVLITSTVRPRDSHIGILVDNSISMTLPHQTRATSRGDEVMAMLYGQEGLIGRLIRDHTVRTFAFDRGARPISGPADLAFDGTRTDLSRALQDVAEAMQGQPRSSLVLITDGADNAGDDPLQSAGILNARGMPVHVIGVGAETPEKDIEISRVHTTDTVMEDALFELQVTLTNRGYAGLETEVLVENEERVIASQKVVLGPEGQPQLHTLHLVPGEGASPVYTARIAAQQDEANTENNQLSFLVATSTRQAQVLYIEGHPRNEYKFIRRAVAKDRAVRVKTYLMTGPRKFLRQNIESPLELADGYPDSEAELFAYDAVIFGDVPAGFFNAEQLALTRAFVSRRGGGFLMLGGATAFDAGFIGTPIEDLLPLTMLRERDLPPELRAAGGAADHPVRRLFTPRLTDEGRRSLILRLDTDDDANRRRWLEMPMLQGINVAGRVKPGATVLAVHPELTLQGEALPLLAHERYGRGRTMVAMTATTWRWQMLKPHEDTSHEQFWRQMLRWLTADTPARTDIVIKPGAIGTGDVVTVRARLYDETYRPVSTPAVWLKITDPDGVVSDQRASADIERPGEYLADVAAARPGVYQVAVSAPDADPPADSATRSFLVSNSVHEMRDAALDQDLLAGIAAAGGGRYVPAGSADKLIAHLKTTRTMGTENIQSEIWDMPLIFLLLLIGLTLEWLLRRRKGLS